MTRPRSRSRTSSARRPTWPSASAPPRRGAVHADRGRPPVQRPGELRYMLGGEPILTPDGEPLIDARGRPSYVTSAGSGPSVGKHLLLAYLPPEQAVAGTARSVEYLGERVPGDGGVAGSTPLFDPENERVRADAAMEILVCVKRVPMVGGKIVVTADGQDVDTRMSGFTVSPHEECAVEEAVQLVERHGGGVTVLTLGPPAAADQLRDMLALGASRAVLLETDGREWGPIATAAAIAGRGPPSCPTTCCCSATRRPTPATTRSPSGSRTRSACPVSPGSRTSRSPTAGAQARREYRGTEEIYDLPLPAVVRVKEGINLPRYPSLPGRLRAKRATIEQSVPANGTPRACARSGCGCRPARPSGPRSSAPASTRYPPWSPCSTSSGCCHDRAVPGRAGRRRGRRRLAARPDLRPVASGLDGSAARPPRRPAATAAPPGDEPAPMYQQAGDSRRTVHLRPAAGTGGGGGRVRRARGLRDRSVRLRRGRRVRGRVR